VLSGLPWDIRVAVWDRAFVGVRSWFRREGLKEVSTPVRVGAPAIEPFIEPLAAPPGFLATSPELSMKRLLCRGSGSIFQVAHVFRGAEVGRRHAEEFHMIEWYRVAAQGDATAAFSAIRADVEGLVESVRAEIEGLDLPRSLVQIPGQIARWEEVDGPLHLAETLGVEPSRLNSGHAIAEALVRLRAQCAVGDAEACSPLAPVSDATVHLAQWTELFSLWSDGVFDPWLREKAAKSTHPSALHLIGFPAALAALAEIREGVGMRFESYVGDLELANGYLELRDPVEQHQRFVRANGLREMYGRTPLPLDRGFLADLGRGEGLPPSAGAALGLERLLMHVCGSESIDDITLAVGGP